MTDRIVTDIDLIRVGDHGPILYLGIGESGQLYIVADDGGEPGAAVPVDRDMVRQLANNLTRIAYLVEDQT